MKFHNSSRYQFPTVWTHETEDWLALFKTVHGTKYILVHVSFFQLNECTVIVFFPFWESWNLRLGRPQLLSSFKHFFFCSHYHLCAYPVLLFNCRCEAIKHQNKHVYHICMSNHVQQPCATANTRRFFNASRCALWTLAINMSKLGLDLLIS
jgi:hypothetical protein